MEEKVHINNTPNHYFPIEEIHSYEENVSRLVNGKVQFKSPVKSMKGKINQLMINVTLSKNFDKKQFKIISSIPPDQWIKSQRQLMLKICQQKKLYEQSFTLFYKNHHTIANWCQLATRQKSLIEPYVFRQLLRHRKSEYAIQQSFNNERVKNSISIIKKKSIDKKYILASINKNGERKSSNLTQGSLLQNDSNLNGQSENASFMKPSLSPAIGMRRYGTKHKTMEKSQMLSQNKQQMMSIFFNNSIKVDRKQRKRKPLNLQRFKHQKKQSHDAHQLYMKTFDACNGWNYIFYDYERHMKGFGEKGKYNKFVRNGDGSGEEYVEGRYRSSMIGTENSSRQVKRFVEFDEFRASQNKEKCSLLPMNLVLNERELNNYQGLKRVVSENKSSKVVFVNHQGKPITYYIKKDDQKGRYRIGETLKKTTMIRQSTSVTDESKKIPCVENSTTLR